MSGEAPKPPETDPAQVAQAAALEDAPAAESLTVLPIEIQEVVDPDTAGQPADDPAARDSETEARIQDLRNRGRVGILTEGTERPDTSNRMKNSEHDSDAIAAVNKANRLARQQREEREGYDDKLRIGETFETATARKLAEVAGEYSKDPDLYLRKYFEDPMTWEAKLRDKLRERGNTAEKSEDLIKAFKESYDRKLARIGEKWDASRADWLQNSYKVLESKTQGQDQFRGDLLELYARDPEKYKAMQTEEFVAKGREFKASSERTSRFASLESWGRTLNEVLPGLLKDTSSISEFTIRLNEQVTALRYRMQNHGISEGRLIRFVEAIEGKEALQQEIPEDPSDLPAYQKSIDDRKDTEHRLENSTLRGYFSAADFAKDLDRTPREQMKEAVERAKVVTDGWIEAGKKAREEFDETWGKAPEGEEPEPKVA